MSAPMMTTSTFAPMVRQIAARAGSGRGERINRNANFAQLARSISMRAFQGRIPRSVPLDEIVSAVIVSIPAVRDAGEMETQIFADNLRAALLEEMHCQIIAGRLCS